MNRIRQNLRWANKRATWALRMTPPALFPDRYALAYWFDDLVNFGDLITKYILSKELPEKTTVNIKGAPKDFGMAIAGAGSILQSLNYSNCVVWGSGFIGSTWKARPARPVHVLAYRGPKSADLAGNLSWPVVENYGDPGVLLPTYVPKPEALHRTGLVLHYEHEKYLPKYLPWVKIISVRRQLNDVIRDLSSCESIVSSSLHGVILAHAYGIPCVWIRFPTLLKGDEFKFHDFFGGLGLQVDSVRLRDRRLDASDITAVLKDAFFCDYQSITQQQDCLKLLLRQALNTTESV